MLVTGGAKGIGQMISTGFVRNGATVYIASRDAASCEQVAQELTKLGPGKAYALPADLQKYDDIKRLVGELEKREKCLHVLVNNSGANWGESYDSYPDQAFTKVMMLNLQRVFTLTQACTPLLERAVVSAKDNGGVADPARVINIGSIDGLRVPALET